MSRLIESSELNHPQEQGAPTAVDIRSPDAYAAGHVPDAINIPVDELGSVALNSLQDRPVVTDSDMYHSGPSQGERAADLWRLPCLAGSD